MPFLTLADFSLIAADPAGLRKGLEELLAAPPALRLPATSDQRQRNVMRPRPPCACARRPSRLGVRVQN